jgi:uncharacterized protein YcfJ
MNTKTHIIGLAVVALALAGVTGCNTTPVQDGAVAGGAIGAGAGAIIGNQSGKAGEGALIGAGIGALTGALIGDRVDERRDRNAGQQQVQQAPPPAQSTATQSGHWETRTVRTQSGETYEERVWVPSS